MDIATPYCELLNTNCRDNCTGDESEFKKGIRTLQRKKAVADLGSQEGSLERNSLRKSHLFFFFSPLVHLFYLISFAQSLEPHYDVLSVL